MSTPYDEVAYPGWPYRQTHPLRTSALAALLGVPYADPAACRVLEVGCGDAANLIPMALTAPGSQFTGFDLAEAPIARGRTVAEALGLSNLRLQTLDILEAGDGLGQFDYIVAHGVYSWVPEAVREGLMRLVKGHLAPGGLAFVSYNTLPGCRMRQALRDLLLYHLGGPPNGPEAADKVREVLKLFLQGASTGDPLVAAMRLQAQALLERDPAVVFHDELSDHWQPFYLHEFAAAAGVHELEVLSDVEGMSLRQELFPTALGDALRDLSGGDATRSQQYQDFFNGRLFHQSLLRHAGETPASRRFDAARVRKLYAGASAKLEPPAEGDAPGEVRIRFSASHMIKIDDPVLQSVLLRLGEAWPQLLPIADMPGDDTAEALAQLFTAGHIELQTGPWPRLAKVSERPSASPLARLQLARGLPHVTTLDMCTIKLDDEAGRVFLGLLDSARDAHALAVQIAQVTGQEVSLAEPRVGPHLQRLAGMGLLIS